MNEGHETVLVLEDDHAILMKPYRLFLYDLEKVQRSGYKWNFILLETYNLFGADIPEGLTPYFTRISCAHNTHAVVWSARGIHRGMASGFFERCVVPLDEYLRYMTNPGRHPRTDYHNCLGPGGGALPERLAGLRWRGMCIVQELEPQDVSTINPDEAGVGQPPQRDELKHSPRSPVRPTDHLPETMKMKWKERMTKS